MANDIPRCENDDQSLRMLATQRDLYRWAKRITFLQVVLVILLPGVLILINRLTPTFEVWSAFTGLLIAVLDVAAVDPLISGFREKAAAMQEWFDCRALDLEWPELIVCKPDREDVRTNVTPDETKLLRNWYPISVETLPLHVARIICQRSNCRWDAKLRRFYGRTVMFFGVAVIVFLTVVAIGANLSFGEFMVSFLTPVLPLILWSFREARQHNEAAERIDRLKTFGDQLWSRTMNRSLDETGLRGESRKFQDEIYRRRERSPLVFDWFYYLFRNRFETQMQNSAAEMVAEAHSHNF
jgi:hypothetical protein